MEISTEQSNYKFVLVLYSTFILLELVLSIQTIILFGFIQQFYMKISAELSNYSYVWFYIANIYDN